MLARDFAMTVSTPKNMGNMVDSHGQARGTINTHLAGKTAFTHV